MKAGPLPIVPAAIADAATRRFLTSLRKQIGVNQESGAAAAAAGGDSLASIRKQLAQLQKQIDAIAAANGAVHYVGDWDASTGDAPVGAPRQGDYVEVIVAGSTELSGITEWKVHDWAVYTGTRWQRVNNSDPDFVTAWDDEPSSAGMLVGTAAAGIIDYTLTVGYANRIDEGSRMYVPEGITFPVGSPGLRLDGPLILDGVLGGG